MFVVIIFIVFVVVDSIMKSLVNPGEEKTQDVLKKADDFIEKVSEVKAVKKYKPQDNTGGSWLASVKWRCPNK